MSRFDPMLVYVSGGNNESEFRILDECDNTVVKAMKLKRFRFPILLLKMITLVMPLCASPC